MVCSRNTHRGCLAVPWKVWKQTLHFVVCAAYLSDVFLELIVMRLRLTALAFSWEVGPALAPFFCATSRLWIALAPYISAIPDDPEGAAYVSTTHCDYSIGKEGVGVR